MKARTLMEKAYNIFTHQPGQTTKKEKAMKRLLAGLALATLGLGTPVHAGSFVTVLAEDIEGLVINTDYTALLTYAPKTPCGVGRQIRVEVSDARHDRVAMLFTLAHTTGQDLGMWVDCVGTAGYAKGAELYKPQ